MRAALGSTGSMVTLKMSNNSITIGVLAEDTSDVEVIYNIFSKYAPSNSYSVKKFVGNGCGKLKNKCAAWAKNLVASGCDHVIMLHDLDRNEEAKLRSDLEKKICRKAFPKSIIVIPTEELEAWLLSDPDAIKSVFGLKKAPTKIQDCEEISSPKEHLRDLVWQLGKKRYLNATHNKKLSEALALANLRRCKSYMPLDDYITKHIFPPQATA